MRRRDFIKMSAGFGAATLAPISAGRAQTKALFKAADVQPRRADRNYVGH